MLAAAETHIPIPPPAKRTGWGRRLALGAAVLIAAGGFLVADPVQVRDAPMLESVTRPGERPTLTESDLTPSRSNAAPSRTSAPPDRSPTTASGGRGSPEAPVRGRTFAWAPVSAASGYHVELFRGSALVFTADVPGAEVVIPTRWRLRGRAYRLEPGAYRWYVWPAIGGRRQPKAIVQTELVVPAR